MGNDVKSPKTLNALFLFAFVFAVIALGAWFAVFDSSVEYLAGSLLLTIVINA